MLTGASPGQQERDVPLGVSLQRLGCSRASGHSQGDGDHIISRAMGKGMTRGVVGSKVDSCMCVFPRLL